MMIIDHKAGSWLRGGGTEREGVQGGLWGRIMLIWGVRFYKRDSNRVKPQMEVRTLVSLSLLWGICLGLLQRKMPLANFNFAF